MAALNRAGRGLAPAAFLVLALAAQYGDALRAPFLGDDYSILDKTSHAPFLSLASRAHAFLYWWRPWSRELHYWTMQRLFGVAVLPWHLVSFALWLGIMLLAYALARRLVGPAAAAVACAAIAALASWGGTLFWVAGVQELWMLLFALLYLDAFARRRTWLATLALALALLSKETAGVLPGIALVWALAVDRERPGPALQRVAPQVALIVAWLFVHPWILPRLTGAHVAWGEAGTKPPLPRVLARAVLALVNLEQWPAPEGGWMRALLAGLPGIVVLIGFAAWGVLRPARADGAAQARPAAADPRGVTIVCIAWAILGTLPLLMPSIGWHAYYGLLGAIGAWLLAARALARRPALAIAVVAVLAMLRPARAATPTWDWSSKSYFARAGFFIERLHADLIRRHPTLPPHARLYFARVPRNIGLVVGGGPAFRVWYRDTTLRADFYSDYAPRAAGAPTGPDYFFSFDSTLAWREVVKGREDVAAALRADPDWEPEHVELALLFGHAGDWPAAAGELEKLVAAFPDDPSLALNLALCLERSGDRAGALAAARRAVALPGAGEGTRRAAAELTNRLQEPAQPAKAGAHGQAH